MNAERRNLLVFGYGFSLIIPFLITWKLMHMEFNVWNVALLVFSFCCVLIVVAKIAAWPPKINLWILAVHFYLLAQNLNILLLILLCVAFGFLIVTILKVDLLKPLYSKWMKVAHFIGTLITDIILCVVFYVLFGIAGIILRILKKDLLDRAIHPSSASYWIKRKQTDFDKKCYSQQF